MGGGDALKELARRQGFELGGEDWWDTQDGMRFLERRSANPEFDRQVDDMLKEAFYRGGAVITSYTLAWLVDGGVKIWLAGSHENSAARMQGRDNIAKKDALAITEKRYMKNKDLYKRLYGFEFGRDGKIFDVVIDTDDLGAEQVIAAAVSAVGELL